MNSPLMQTYARLPVAFDRGEGAWLWDKNGKKYLDALAGIAVCGLGHAHPLIADAICDQARRLLHTSNIYEIPLQTQLAAELTALSGMDNAFLANSGAEANEAAIKIARLYGHQRNIDKPVIVVMEQAFHGRTLATLTATGNRKVQAGFEPLVSGFVRVPFGDLKALETVAGNTPDVVAVLLEPIQGEGGIRIPEVGYLHGVREICNHHEWLMMLDEIQSGISRTGQMFAFQHAGITPDVLTLAKGLGNGFPVAVCLARGAAARAFKPGNHGSTFGGNPLACRVALTVLQILQKENLAARAEELGQRMLAGFNDSLGGIKGVKTIRGHGLMIGIELEQPCKELVALALEQSLLINVTAERVIRLLPPLIISTEEADQIVNGVSAVIREFLGA
ncbi:MAG: aspartate aminotransferase family protein [Proteobacteria bacterium]|nr:MAG: aspartate aminotransferase family protein [Pseudomonadota bacterium]